MAMEKIAPQITRVGGLNGQQQPGRVRNESLQGPSFKDALSAELVKNRAPSEVAGVGQLKFSNHAVDRMQNRGIHYTPEQLQSIEGAVAKAAGKGAKETLVLTDNSALIVSVKNSTVVTVMDKNALKENVFTNIDSTVVI